MNEPTPVYGVSNKEGVAVGIGIGVFVGAALGFVGSIFYDIGTAPVVCQALQ